MFIKKKLRICSSLNVSIQFCGRHKVKIFKFSTKIYFMKPMIKVKIRSVWVSLGFGKPRKGKND